MDNNSTDGLLELDVSSMDIQYGIGVGQDGDTGDYGQVLSSGGRDEPMRWVANGVVGNERLTAGTNITMTPSSFFDGTAPITISSSLPTYTAGNGIAVSVGVITADTDETTCENTGGTGTQISVLKVPNTLTITDSSSASIVYDGSANKSITISDTDTTYKGIVPIFIQQGVGQDEISLSFDSTLSSATLSQLSVVKVPNTLTMGNGLIMRNGGNDFDGSSANVLDIYPDSTTIGFDGSARIEVLKLPNALTAGSGISFSSGTTFDGSAPITITATDGAHLPNGSRVVVDSNDVYVSSIAKAVGWAQILYSAINPAPETTCDITFTPTSLNVLFNISFYTAIQFGTDDTSQIWIRLNIISKDGTPVPSGGISASERILYEYPYAGTSEDEQVGIINYTYQLNSELDIGSEYVIRPQLRTNTDNAGLGVPSIGVFVGGNGGFATGLGGRCFPPIVLTLSDAQNTNVLRTLS